MSQSNVNSINIPETIQFIRQKDYKFIQPLGRGGCGTTILIKDEVINENFVCKKYSPFYSEYREKLFKNFKEEIKLLHLLFHKNIVRVFNYHIYDEHLTGYIIMEYIQGVDITTYIENNPENINDIFTQVIDGFSYLEDVNILHRDIRPQNIMVNNDDQVKIIDFGFGKRVSNKEDFDKSISLNWWCEIPKDFQDKTYDFKTEVYFIGKLFEQIIQKNGLGAFKYKQELSGMCKLNPVERFESFIDVKQSMIQNQSQDFPFSEEEKSIYKGFADALLSVISEQKYTTEYHLEVDTIQDELEKLYQKVMLEDYIPKNTFIIDCFFKGGYKYWNNKRVKVFGLKRFIDLLKASSKDKKNIILKNLHARFDSVEIADDDLIGEDEIPF